MSQIAAPVSFEIRSEVPADAQAIETVTVAAFQDAPHASGTEQHIVNALRRTGNLAVSLVATADAAVIGHVAISPVSISGNASGWFGLGPISVLPKHQRQGVGSRLICEALRILLERDASGCVVLGEPEYYGRFGFKANPELILPGVAPEYFQVVAFDTSRPTGIVAYHEAFEA
ncbi:MAG TPA: N-acetyltransferase [Steroidobacteraceae bacterium]|nr:N-acetyltransferase [Steroidobacteraceae bacterium]